MEHSLEPTVDMLNVMQQAEFLNKNETARKEILIGNLKSIFHQNPIARLKIDNIYMGAEGKIATQQSSESNSVTGFQDTDLGSVTVEWKRDLTDTRAFTTADLEIRRYTSGKWNEFGYDDHHIGIITDGLRWKAYKASCAEEKEIYSADDVQLTMCEEVDASTNIQSNAIYVEKFLEKYLIKDNVLLISAGTLKANFGENSTFFKSHVSKIYSIVTEIAESDLIVKNQIDLWVKSQQYNYQFPPGRVHNTYSQHIYLVLLGRIIVARSLKLDENAVVDDNLIREMITGELTETALNVTNFVESDYYSWILQPQYIEQFVSIGKEFYFYVKEFNFEQVDKANLFHLIFEEIIPAEARRENGQTSTPESLVKNIFKRIRTNLKSDSKIIEPAVGPGAILGEAIRELRNILDIEEIPKSEQIKIIQQNILGIDVDPIAVILAKATWLLTTAELLPEADDMITIPIYHTDSLIKKLYDDDIVTLELDEENQIISIPRTLAINHGALSKLYKHFDSLAKLALINGDLEGIIDEFQFEGILADEIIELDEVEKIMLEEASDVLIKYFYKKRLKINDGIWQYMLLNKTVPKGLNQEFDFIICNPPWLTISSLPNVRYKNKIIGLAKEYKINPTGSSAHHPEMATVFMLKAIDVYLKPEGDAVFILPGTIMDGDNHYKFRQSAFHPIVNVRFEEFWEIPNNLSTFKVKSCVLFCTKEYAENKEFKYRELITLDEHENVSLGKIYLVQLDKKSAYSTNYNVISSVQNTYLGRFRQGADLMPRTAVFVEKMNSASGKNISISTSKYAANNKNNKKLKNRVFKGIISPKYLFRTIISEMLLPFYILPDELIVALPIKVDDEIKMVSNEELIIKGESYSAKWFSQFDTLEEFQKNSFRKGLDVRGKLTQQNFYEDNILVHMGAGGSQPCAAIQQNNTSHEMKFIADQTTYVAAFSTMEEARYVVGLINSDYINKVIKDFQAEGGFTERHVHKLPLMFIPEFQRTELQLEIVKQVEKIENKICDSFTSDDLDIEKKLTSRRKTVRKKVEDELVILNELVAQLF
ncbi:MULTISPECIES: Eco57I restriction-modification methylase domain-containing protein [Lysinibacillus]|uniref:site-specific DNA-methyltransferase (adenine-specific) n=1 Tax=Lysinibacillus fusiformis TaxID=28031 RepID=A0A1E4QZV3_9BACI|nr:MULTISPECIES: hypothetical protein [Lysinibacillus]ODV53734.1 hypothetical protein BG258_20350 [Lysinibacillus fusiformis]